MSHQQAAPKPAAQPKTRHEFFQELAGTAWRRGQSALSAGQPEEAARWLERAHRIAPKDASITLALATVRIRMGAHETAEALLRELARTHDLRELWLSLASVRRSLGAAGPAAQALGRALSGHALPGQAHLLAMADGIAADAGLPGWCGILEDGRLLVRAPDRLPRAVLVDGQPRRLGRQIVPHGVRELVVLAGDRELLGSPIAVSSVRRVEGVVRMSDGGLEGWAWHPASPEADPVLTIQPWPPDSRPGEPLAVIAEDRDIEAPSPLARPRRFRVARDRLRTMPGMVQITGADGRHLLGSPLDPGAESRAAVAIALATAEGGMVPAEALRFAAIPADVRGPAAAARARPNRPVTVVVPVHGNAPLVHECLESLRTTLPPDAKVIVVDDASPGPDMAALLREAERRPRWQVRRLTINRGFPGAANDGMRAAAAPPGGRDIILLNSDTQVPPGWLEGLRSAVHDAGDIGTATPFSNDATILSYPDPAGDNPPPVALRRLQRLAAAANPGVAVEIPTAVGFCMYIRSECLAQVGLFREDAFAQGYGEENDFCIRARHLGWRHVAVPGVFVAHTGGQSFGAARTQLIERNLAVLERLHPGYRALIDDFQAADPLADARRRLDMQRWRAGRAEAGAVLMITHDSGGGVERVIRTRSTALRTAGKRPILLRSIMPKTGRPDYLPGLCRLDEGAPDADAPGYPNLRFRVPGELAELARLLRGERLEHIEVHHLLGHEHAVLRLAGMLGVPVETHVHDYALFCPRISLVGRDGRYCGEPSDPATCEACVADAGRSVTEDIPIATLRARSAADLAASRRIVVPSVDAAARLRRHFPGISPTVEPLENDADLPEARPTRGGPLNVAVIGGIGTEKGYDILLACARNAAARRLNLRFTVIGHTPDDARLIDTGQVFVTGPYQENEAIALIRRHDVQFAWQPSIWPETWCFTIGLAWQAGLRVAAFDIGAPAERIRRTGRGWLLPLGLPPPAINSALLGLLQAPPAAAPPPVVRLSAAGE